VNKLPSLCRLFSLLCTKQEFSADFIVVHSVYETPVVTANRDAVVAYLTVKQVQTAYRTDCCCCCWFCLLCIKLLLLFLFCLSQKQLFFVFGMFVVLLLFCYKQLRLFLVLLFFLLLFFLLHIQLLFVFVFHVTCRITVICFVLLVLCPTATSRCPRIICVLTWTFRAFKCGRSPTAAVSSRRCSSCERCAKQTQSRGRYLRAKSEKNNTINTTKTGRQTQENDIRPQTQSKKTKFVCLFVSHLFCQEFAESLDASELSAIAPRAASPGKQADTPRGSAVASFQIGRSRKSGRDKTDSSVE
jgi:hypothetical protein